MVSIMYIYQLPFDTNKELCRLLDNDGLWKDLAGIHMGYPPLIINEIEQKARCQASSPTNELFTQWGQQNHRVQELFVLLYYLKHVPALKCLKPLVDERFWRLLYKLESRNGVSHVSSTDENGNRPTRRERERERSSESSLPLPVMLLGQGIAPNCSGGFIGSTQSDSSRSDDTSSMDSERSRGRKVSDDLVMQHASAIHMLTYEELMEATNNWSPNNLLGQGGFGKVYKGEWKLLDVAVKRLDSKDNLNKEFIRELCLNQYRHDNLLPLYGYSFGGPEACLVYQLMSGGTLAQRLYCKTHHPPLTWPQRHKIAHGVAKGIQFLHTMKGTPLIHGDIKPANILLDQCTVPKIGDFGLARKGAYGSDRTHLKVSSLQGTRAYLPLEYLNSRCLSPALDVFSFGVVLLEMATVQPALDPNRPGLRLREFVVSQSRGKDLATLEDRMIYGTHFSNPQLCREFIGIGLRCTEMDRRDRPTMLDVYKKLDAMNVPRNLES